MSWVEVTTPTPTNAPTQGGVGVVTVGITEGGGGVVVTVISVLFPTCDFCSNLGGAWEQGIANFPSPIAPDNPPREKL